MFVSIILCRVRRGFILAAVEEEECCGVAGKVCCLGHVFALCLSCCYRGIRYPLCCQDSAW